MSDWGVRVTYNLLEEKIAHYVERYGKPKWVLFCEYYMQKGFAVYLYDSKSTVSKYITLVYGGKTFKVRFSDHKPSKMKESAMGS